MMQKDGGENNMMPLLMMMTMGNNQAPGQNNMMPLLMMSMMNKVRNNVPFSTYERH